jgi:hypothetical protein
LASLTVNDRPFITCPLIARMAASPSWSDDISTNPNPFNRPGFAVHDDHCGIDCSVGGEQHP